jgi:hypothetical protein
MTMDHDKAARVAAKRNERLKAKYPLFADQLPEQSAEQVRREFDGYARRMEEARARLRARAQEYKAQVKALVTAEELAALEERRQVLPPSEEYEADFWRRHLKRLTDGRDGA